MAQTIGGLSMKDATLETSLNGTTWASHSGTFNEIDVAGGEFPVEDTHTADGLPPIVTEGKPSSFKITVTSVYSEIAGEAQAMVETAYRPPRAGLYVRWTIKGATPGNKVYTSTIGKVVTPPYPRGAVGDAAAILTAWDLVCADVIPSTLV